MHIELECDKEKLKKDIEVLRKTINAIITSPEFKSLFGKTQFLDADVIKGLLSPEERKDGEEWTIRRTRGDHSVNVAAMASRLIDEVYMKSFGYEKRTFEMIEKEDIDGTIKSVKTEKIITNVEKGKEEEYILYCLNKERARLQALCAGYSHDLGHTPFGHDGELAINTALAKYQNENNNDKTREAMSKNRIQLFGWDYEKGLGHVAKGNNDYYLGSVSFEHTEQSYITFLNIVERNGIKDLDLNFLRTAILAHSRSRVKQIPEDFQSSDRLVIHAIRTADKGDYQIVDGEELLKLLNFRKSDEIWEVDQRYISNQMSVIEKELEFIKDWSEDIHLSPILTDKFKSIRNLNAYRDIYEQWALLYCEMHQKDIYKIGEELLPEDITGNDDSKIPIGIVGMFKGNKARNNCLVEKLMTYYLNNPDKIPDMLIQRVGIEAGGNQNEIYKAFDRREWENSKHQFPQEIIAIGFISALTNEGARELYEELVQERIEKGPGNGIEPVTYEEISAINKRYTAEYINKQFENITSELNSEEKSNLMQQLSDVLLSKKEKLREMLTEKGTLVERKAEYARLSDATSDRKLLAELRRADEIRKIQGKEENVGSER